MAPTDRLLTRDLLFSPSFYSSLPFFLLLLTRTHGQHPFLKNGCDPSEFTGLVDKTKEEASRTFDDDKYGEDEAW